MILPSEVDLAILQGWQGWLPTLAAHGKSRFLTVAVL
jgi:hypothetical protein